MNIFVFFLPGYLTRFRLLPDSRTSEASGVFTIMGKACHQAFVRPICLPLLNKPGLAADCDFVDVITKLPCHIVFPCQNTAVEIAASQILQSIFDKRKLIPNVAQLKNKIKDKQQGKDKSQKKITVYIHVYASLLKRYPTPHTV
jgi:hypothetical protein